MRVQVDGNHVLAAALALGWGALILRPVCWWGRELLRELAQQTTPVVLPLSGTGKVVLLLLLLLLLPCAGLVYGLQYVTFAAATFLVLVLVLAWIDAETGYLPDALTQPLLWLGLLFNTYDMFTSLDMAVLGAVCAYSFLWLINAYYRYIRKKSGMGNGDFKLLAALGAWFGLPALSTLLLLSSLGALLYALVIFLAGRWHKDRYVHFGPYLAAAGVYQLFTQL